MGRRAVSSSTANNSSEVEASMLKSRKRPVAPRHFNKEERAIMKRIVDANPHLWSPEQLDIIVRLSQLRHQYQLANAQVNEDGVTVEHQKTGEIVPNPMLKVLATMSSALLSLERSLGIIFISRGNNVLEREKKLPPMPDRKPSRRVSGKPNLRIA